MLLKNVVCFDCSDGPALSLDISQSAANPAALAMAILSTSESVSRTSSNHQVPLVIISQPLPGPITGQSSGPAPLAMADQGDPEGAVDSTVDLVLELENISNEAEESLSSTNVTSLPVAGGPPAGEATPTSSEDSAVHVSVVLRAVNISVILFHLSAGKLTYIQVFERLTGRFQLSSDGFC